ncbi:MAG: hypothetical protein HC898_12640 [Phycisphaerales bacterium]|nr:hypothetical protein [Phycisphaerales bacterium]
MGLQREIEASLVELLEAVKIAQEHLQQMNQAGQQGEQKQPGTPALAPPSAELKLLKAAQLRINSRTSELHIAGKLDGNQTSRAQELARLARRQEEARDLARKLAEQ